MGPALFVRVWSTTLRLPKAPLTTDESYTLVEVELLLLILFCFGQNGWNILYRHVNLFHLGSNFGLFQGVPTILANLGQNTNLSQYPILA